MRIGPSIKVLETQDLAPHRAQLPIFDPWNFFSPALIYWSKNASKEPRGDFLRFIQTQFPKWLKTFGHKTEIFSDFLIFDRNSSTFILDNFQIYSIMSSLTSCKLFLNSNETNKRKICRKEEIIGNHVIMIFAGLVKV